jgi:hypothetical protein
MRTLISVPVLLGRTTIMSRVMEDKLKPPSTPRPTRVPAEMRLGDPLAEVTRKERRSLLIASAVAITIVKTGLVPTKISALGVEFSQADKAALLKVLAAVVIYFLVAFVVYAAADIMRVRVLVLYSVSEWKAWQSSTHGEEPYSGWERYPSLPVRTLLPFLFVARPILEFGAPLMIAGYALRLLL